MFIVNFTFIVSPFLFIYSFKFHIIKFNQIKIKIHYSDMKTIVSNIREKKKEARMKLLTYYYNTNRCSKKYNLLCRNRTFNNLVQFQIRVHIDHTMCIA